MPSIDIKLDVDEVGFDALSGMGSAADAMREWQAANPDRVKVPD